MLDNIWRFFETDIWKIRLDEIPKWQAVPIRQLRILVLTVRGFQTHNGSLWASALTFYTLLSIVPVAALAFGIAKGFGLDRKLESQLLTRVPDQQGTMQKVIEFARSLLDNTQGDLVAGLGVAILIWTVIKVAGNIESSFNEVWGISKTRPWTRKFTDYLSFMFVFPILIIASNSITFYFNRKLDELILQEDAVGFLSPLIQLSAVVLPWVLTWALFTFFYIFLPNTKVRFRSGLIAGMLASLIFKLAQWIYIEFQIGVARNNAIYGSFAALPLFMIWLQLSWLIVLAGAEYSYSHQNVDDTAFNKEEIKLSFATRKFIALAVMHFLVARFVAAKPPARIKTIARNLGIPRRLLNQIVNELVECGIVVEVEGNGNEAGYLPARDPETLTIQYVLKSYESRGFSGLKTKNTPAMQTISSVLDDFWQELQQSPANRTLKDIA